MKDEARLRRIAASANVSVEEVRAVEDRLRAIPMEQFLTSIGFSLDEIVYDPVEHVWIVPDRQYKGPHSAILIIREDKHFVCVEIKPEHVS